MRNIYKNPLERVHYDWIVRTGFFLASCEKNDWVVRPVKSLHPRAFSVLKIASFFVRQALLIASIVSFFWRVKIDKRNWIRGLCKKYAKISAGLPRFNVNINCEVNMNRAQTPTRKTVLVFQFFMFTSQLIFTLKRGSPADIFAYIIERKTYIFHEISFHQVFWRIP